MVLSVDNQLLLLIHIVNFISLRNRDSKKELAWGGMGVIHRCFLVLAMKG